MQISDVIDYIHANETIELACKDWTLFGLMQKFTYSAVVFLEIQNFFRDVFELISARPSGGVIHSSPLEYRERENW